MAVYEQDVLPSKPDLGLRNLVSQTWISSANTKVKSRWNDFVLLGGMPMFHTLWIKCFFAEVPHLCSTSPCIKSSPQLLASFLHTPGPTPSFLHMAMGQYPRSMNKISTIPIPGSHKCQVAHIEKRKSSNVSGIHGTTRNKLCFALWCSIHSMDIPLVAYLKSIRWRRILQTIVLQTISIESIISYPY